MPANRYLTIAGEGQDEFTEKRSRFIGAIRPVTTEEEALAFIRERCKTYWDAKHNVHAYILDGGNLCRFSDDGEPQGTAGIPVLDVLRKEGLTDCVVVVTRYFGGILLGGGGLVRAYSHGAKLAVDAAGVVEMRLCLAGEITCDYARYGFIPAFLAEEGATVTDTLFEEEVTVRFSLPVENRGHPPDAPGSPCPWKTGGIWRPLSPTGAPAVSRLFSPENCGCRTKCSVASKKFLPLASVFFHSKAASTSISRAFSYRAGKSVTGRGLTPRPNSSVKPGRP